MNKRNARSLGARTAALACGVLLLAACGGTPAELCARQVSYWAAQALAPTTTTYGDYQTMGLSGSTYELVLDISKDAKRFRKTATHEQTLAFIAEEAKRRCAKTVATCTTTGHYNGFPSC
jgi:hypothetical protein